MKLMLRSTNQNTFAINQELVANTTSLQAQPGHHLLMYNYKARFELIPLLPHQKINSSKLNDLIGKSYRGDSCQCDLGAGFTLIEVLICTFLIAIIASTLIESFSRQIAQQQLNEVTHAFIQDAQLARQLSRQLNIKVSLQPANERDPQNWSNGWAIVQPTDRSMRGILLKTYPLNQPHLHAQVQIATHLLKDSQQFTDMSAPKKARHISFLRGEPALLHNGGFVANRIIWQHKRYPELMRHVILGPGGRWRICDPGKDSQKCL